MIHPDQAVRECMKDVGKILRPMGFRGSANLWTAVTDTGRVTIRRSSRNNWHDGARCAGARGFVFGQQVVPEAWWRYRNWRRERDGRQPLPIGDARITGPDVLECYGLPTEPVSPTRHWSMRAENRRGEVTALTEDLEFIDAHLGWAVEQLARRGLELIEPARYLKELLNQPKQDAGDWEPLVVFLAEYGPSSALDDAIEGLLREYRADDVESIVEYARSR